MTTVSRACVSQTIAMAVRLYLKAETNLRSGCAVSLLLKALLGHAGEIGDWPDEGQGQGGGEFNTARNCAPKAVADADSAEATEWHEATRCTDFNNLQFHELQDDAVSIASQ